jgi:signal transduction histidine kinase
MASLRRTLADLRAPAADCSLPAALQPGRELQARAGVAVTCRLDRAERRRPPMCARRSGMCARGAHQCRSHAAAARHGAVQAQPGGWRLQIGDDGSGISATDLHESERYGVVGMRERVAMLGGTFSIRRGAGGGSIVGGVGAQPDSRGGERGMTTINVLIAEDQTLMRAGPHDSELSDGFLPWWARPRTGDRRSSERWRCGPTWC